MDGEERPSRLRDFMLGGLVGAAAAVAAMWRKGPPQKQPRGPAGLAAFESAPCYREAGEAEPRSRS